MTESYRALMQIDRGGQGSVWECERESDGLRFAMKYLHVDPASITPHDDLARFGREIRFQSALQHPGVIQVTAYDLKGNPPYLVMPLAQGTLGSEIRQGTVTEERALSLFSQILNALAYAHGQGFIHRDLKPANVLILDNRAVLADFGLAKRSYSDSTRITSTGWGMGTLGFGAPEQFRDAHSADERSDIYALGMILYQMVTGGEPVFPTFDIKKAPTKYRYIINKCIDQDPAGRYQSVKLLQTDIELLLAPPSSFDPPLARAQQLAQRALGDDPTALEQLDKLLNENQSDELLYTKFVPYMPQPLIEEYIGEFPTGFRTMLIQFDEYADGRHPFSYTDVLADFLEKVFHATSDDHLRKLALKRVLNIGWDHHRFYVGGVCGRMFEACTHTSDAMMAADLLRENSSAAQFAAQYINRSKANGIITAVLGAAVA